MAGGENPRIEQSETIHHLSCSQRRFDDVPSTCVVYAPDGASDGPCDSIGMGASPDLLAAFRDDPCCEAGLSTNHEAVSDAQKSLGGEDSR